MLFIHAACQAIRSVYGYRVVHRFVHRACLRLLHDSFIKTPGTPALLRVALVTTTTATSCIGVAVAVALGHRARRKMYTRARLFA